MASQVYFTSYNNIKMFPFQKEQTDKKLNVHCLS